MRGNTWVNTRIFPGLRKHRRNTCPRVFALTADVSMYDHGRACAHRRGPSAVHHHAHTHSTHCVPSSANAPFPGRLPLQPPLRPPGALRRRCPMSRFTLISKQPVPIAQWSTRNRPAQGSWRAAEATLVTTDITTDTVYCPEGTLYMELPSLATPLYSVLPSVLLLVSRRQLDGVIFL